MPEAEGEKKAKRKKIQQFLNMSKQRLKGTYTTSNFYRICFQIDERVGILVCRTLRHLEVFSRIPEKTFLWGFGWFYFLSLSHVGFLWLHGL